MKNFLKSTLLIAFSTAFICGYPQISSSNLEQENLFNKVEHLIDSLQKTQRSAVDAEIPGAKNNDVKEVDLDQAFQEAEISGNVKVILTNGPNGKLWLKGNRFELEHTKVNLKNGKLVVNCGYKTKSGLQLYVSALDMTCLVINGDSEIFSSGTINASALQIILNGTSMVSVRYKGKLNVFSGDKTELISVEDYQKIVSRK